MTDPEIIKRLVPNLCTVGGCGTCEGAIRRILPAVQAMLLEERLDGHLEGHGCPETGRLRCEVIQAIERELAALKEGK